jgi:hypothetical protein
MKKQLIIISGITGALGNAILADCSRNENIIVYGISRKSTPFEELIDPLTGLLHTKTIIGSIGELSKRNFEKFADIIDYQAFERISYIHAVGLYLFEVNENGKHTVENDKDGDGINDDVLRLTYTYFTGMVEALALGCARSDKKLNALIFGGIADVHRPIVHESWWKTIEKTKEFMRTFSIPHGAMQVLNISSVICAHEVATRPFVFINTDADARFWLTPEEIARKVHELLVTDESKFIETDFFHKSPYFHEDYYHDRKFTPRKVGELYQQ